MGNLYELREGQIPVAGIFLGKHNYGYKTRPSTSSHPNARDESDYSADEIRERYIATGSGRSDLSKALMKTQPATNDFAPPTLKDSDFRLSPSDFPTFDFATIDYPLDWRSFLPSTTRKISQKFAQNPLGYLSLYSIKARRRMTGGGSACAVGVAALPSVRSSVAL